MAPTARRSTATRASSAARPRVDADMRRTAARRWSLQIGSWSTSAVGRRRSSRSSIGRSRPVRASNWRIAGGDRDGEADEDEVARPDPEWVGNLLDRPVGVDEPFEEPADAIAGEGCTEPERQPLRRDRVRRSSTAARRRARRGSTTATSTPMWNARRLVKRTTAIEPWASKTAPSPKPWSRPTTTMTAGRTSDHTAGRHHPTPDRRRRSPESGCGENAAESHRRRQHAEPDEPQRDRVAGDECEQAGPQAPHRSPSTTRRAFAGVQPEPARRGTTTATTISISRCRCERRRYRDRGSRASSRSVDAPPSSTRCSVSPVENPRSGLCRCRTSRSPSRPR